VAVEGRTVNCHVVLWIVFVYVEFGLQPKRRTDDILDQRGEVGVGGGRKYITSVVKILQ
jgi:hypothetical protein